LEVEDVTRVWVSALAVTLANTLLKASGPLVLGRHRLPAIAVKVTTLLAPVLLAGLVVTDLAGRAWRDFDWTQTAGVAAGLLAGLLRAPTLLAVGCAIAATAVLRILGA
jgi:branched-subunit amino acid transport protein